MLRNWNAASVGTIQLELHFRLEDGDFLHSDGFDVGRPDLDTLEMIHSVGRLIGDDVQFVSLDESDRQRKLFAQEKRCF